MTSGDEIFNDTYRRFHGQPKPKLPKSQYRAVNCKLHPHVYQKMYCEAAAEGITVTEWVTRAIEIRLENER